MLSLCFFTMAAPPGATISPLLDALAAHKVSASVVDVDHYRIHGGMAIETDYIIAVEPTEEDDKKETFESFRLSKTYSSFRSLSSQLKKNAEKSCAKLNGDIPPDLARAVKFTESVNHLIESQKTEYLGKASYEKVKVMAKQRSQIINDALDMIVHNFPKEESKNLKGIAEAIENFFLTDHCEEEDSAPSTPKNNMTTPSRRTPGKKHRKDRTLGSGINIIEGIGNLFVGPSSKDLSSAKKDVTFTSPVVPISKKTRRSIVVRAVDEEMLQASASLVAVDDDGSAVAPPTKPAPAAMVKSEASPLSDFFANNPYVVIAAMGVILGVLRRAQYKTITMDSDYAMLASFAFFCVGLNWPRPPSVVMPTATTALRRRKTVAQVGQEPTNRQLLRTSMMASPTVADAARSVRDWDTLEEEEEPMIQSPMQTYPEGAPLGEHFNCVSEPDSETFHVRGPDYFVDKVKVPSKPFLFPTRGVDLFLTDNAPENVGSNSGCMGGKLRDVPTFIINFRLPWGVLVFYSEIPERFLPFLHSCYDPFFEGKLPSLDEMTPGDRTLARFLMGNDEHKNKTLKIVPVVVKGPWIVQSVAGGKPAIVGTKMPLNYIYGPKIGNQAEYLEADLDVVASAIARKICSVVASYTHGVTIDLGFVVEGQADDELPEQMLLAARLHGIDPIHAPALPPMKDMFMIDEPPSMDDEDKQ